MKSVAQRFFEDNISRVPMTFGQPQDTQAWNTNQGLAAMAQQLDEVLQLLQSQQQEIRQLRSDLRALRTR